MSEENRIIVRRFYEEVMNRRNLEAANDFLAEDLVGHDRAVWEKSGLESFKQSLASFIDAFPDLHVSIQDEISVGDRVVVRWTDHGTHRGEFLGIVPTGRKMSTTGISIFRIADSKIVEQWTNWDTMTLVSQLGAGDRPPRDLIGRMLAAQEEERRRVSYEVHDGLAQTAVAAHSLLETYAARNPDSQELRRVLELVQGVVVESRQVIGRLRPTALDDFGLAAATAMQVEALRKEGWNVRYCEALGKERLPAEVETALFRVAQEALTNVRKHAGTYRARIKLSRLNGAVRLRIRDWGSGFETSNVVGGGAWGERVGLYGMRERVALIGGKLEVLSKPSVGTLVVAQVPIDGAKEDDGR